MNPRSLRARVPYVNVRFHCTMIHVPRMSVSFITLCAHRAAIDSNNEFACAAGHPAAAAHECAENWFGILFARSSAVNFYNLLHLSSMIPLHAYEGMPCTTHLHIYFLIRI